jgi:hypothetical protein
MNATILLFGKDPLIRKIRIAGVEMDDPHPEKLAG